MNALELQHGQRFGRLTVLRKAHSKDDRYRVGCECGNNSNTVRGSRLVKGIVTECARCAKRRAHWA